MNRPELDLSKLRFDTLLAHAGRDPSRSERAVNPPVHRATTLLAADVAELYDAPKTYALDGMAVQEALRAALLAIEGGAGCVLSPSGLTACTLAILAVARADSEILITDSVYKPTRRFCDHSLKRFNVKPIYYEPRIGAGIADLITDKTCAVFLESPGSLTFELQDVPAICAAAKTRNIPTIIDNTWSAGVYFKPFDHGVDISVQALSKYQAGHADAFMGSVIGATKGLANKIWLTSKDLGLGVSPDDAFLVLRGLRTLSVRLERQSANALTIARWLEARPEVARVLHPALESSQDHALWKRDFTGASALFGIILKQAPEARVNAMLESLKLFGMGFSWGGYESLAIPCDQQIVHTATPWRAEGPCIRLSIGLEHVDDLIADLDQAFAALR
jgi:cystathionine beta-lyase